MVDRQLPISSLKIQPLQHFFDARFVGIAAAMLIRSLQIAVLSKEIIIDLARRHARFEHSHLHFEIAQRGKDGQHFAVYRIGAAGKGLHGFLVQIAQSAIAGTINAPFDGPINSGQNAQQTGLAYPIGTDQANLTGVFDLGRNAMKDLIVVKTLDQPMRS